MSADFNSIANYWKETYSQECKKTKKYEHSAQFKRMADLMAPREPSPQARIHWQTISKD